MASFKKWIATAYVNLTWAEVSGSLGDLGTFLPLLVSLILNNKGEVLRASRRRRMAVPVAAVDPRWPTGLKHDVKEQETTPKGGSALYEKINVASQRMATCCWMPPPRMTDFIKS
jgi:hypothetical protein